MTKQRSPITTHILDLSTGLPAANITVSLEWSDDLKKWKTLSEKRTNADGRIEDFLSVDYKLVSGVYRLIFKVRSDFFPEVPIVFNVDENRGHYHVPLLLSPFGYSTYRGS